MFKVMFFHFTARSLPKKIKISPCFWKVQLAKVKLAHFMIHRVVSK